MNASLTRSVIHLIAYRLPVDADTITETSRLVEDLGADSLDIAELAMDLEDSFSVKFPNDLAELPKFNIVKDIVAYIDEGQTPLEPWS
jgi:acyl carrier protein